MKRLAHSAVVPPRPRIRFRHFAAVFLGLSLFAASMSWLFTVRTGASMWTLQPDPTATLWYVVAMNLVYWGSWASLAPLVLRLASRWRFDRGHWRQSLPIHVAAGAAIAGVHVVVVATGRTLLQRAVGMDVSWHERVWEMFLRTIDWDLMLYCALVALQHAVDYYEELRVREVSHAQLETRLIESQLLALQRQLHPHFLFNTLHAISAFVHSDPDKADAMIERLSDLLRITLAKVGDQEVTLAEELEYLRAYLDIEQVHFGSRLDVTYKVDAHALGVLVPNLILQPLAENAIRHGLEPRAERGSLSIEARCHEQCLMLRIADNGRGMMIGEPDMRLEGVGLANTRARLARLYRGDATLTLTETAGGGVTVTIALPLRAQGPHETQSVRRRRPADGARAIAGTAGTRV